LIDFVYIFHSASYNFIMADTTSGTNQVLGNIFAGAGKLFEFFKNNGDLMAAFAIVGIVVMLVVPLPSFLLDLLISVNIAVGLVLVLSATYLEDALDFSVFPSLLLITTLFRLGLNVSSTKLILLDGANFNGEVIQAFGNFVVGGDYVVGIIVFIILVLIQFMVITKGSERVAEVAARFTLDAMPGKQMAIDADLNAGIIDEMQARERREKIAAEADFYGAMDGASKFVKGDSIAGIIITVINIIGGIIIGYFSGQFEGVAEIAQTYTLLTIGDGLVSIIPSLLISVATGIVVTKTVSEKNLGNEVVAQILAKPKALAISAAVFLFFAMIPGLPKLPFFVLATILGLVSYTLMGGWDLPLPFFGPKEDEEDPDSPDGAPSPDGVAGQAGGEEEGEQAEQDSSPEDVSQLLHVDPLELEIGYGLIPMVDPNQGGDLLNRVKMIRRQIALEMGLVVPAVRIRDNMQLQPNNYSIKLKGIEIGNGEIYHDRFLAMDPGMVSQKVEGLETVEPAFNLPALWIEEAKREEAEFAGYTVVDAPSVVATHLTELVKRYASELLGRQETRDLVEKIKEHSPAVVDAAVPEMDIKPLGVVQKVLQSLLKESVSIRNLTTILEVIADWMNQVKDYNELVEVVRQGLARQITKDYAVDNELHVMTLDPQIEQQFIDSVQKTSNIQQALAPDEVSAFFHNLAAEAEKMEMKGYTPILMTHSLVRIYVKEMTERQIPRLVVLAFQEIASDVSVEHESTVGIGESA